MFFWLAGFFFPDPFEKFSLKHNQRRFFYQMKSSKPKQSGGNTISCPSSRGWSPFCFWCAGCLPVCGICIHANRCLCCLCAIGGVHGVRDACLSDDDTGCRQLPNVVSGSSTPRAKVADGALPASKTGPGLPPVLAQLPLKLHLCLLTLCSQNHFGDYKIAKK